MVFSGEPTLLQLDVDGHAGMGNSLLVLLFALLFRILLAAGSGHDAQAVFSESRKNKVSKFKALAAHQITPRFLLLGETGQSKPTLRNYFDAELHLANPSYGTQILKSRKCTHLL